MSRQVNQRGWIVLESIESGFGAQCVDLFEDPAGALGFELLRADPEDTGRWTAIGGFSAARFDGREAVAAAALSAVPWLRRPEAAQSLRAWVSESE